MRGAITKVDWTRMNPLLWKLKFHLFWFEHRWIYLDGEFVSVGSLEHIRIEWSWNKEPVLLILIFLRTITSKVQNWVFDMFLEPTRSKVQIPKPLHPSHFFPWNKSRTSKHREPTTHNVVKLMKKQLCRINDFFWIKKGCQNFKKISIYDSSR
jgi:hypothetical protein